MEHPGRFYYSRVRDLASQLSRGAVGRAVCILGQTLKAPKQEAWPVNSELGHYIQLHIMKGEGMRKTN